MGWDFACMRLGFSLEALQNGPCSAVPRDSSCDNSTRLSYTEVQERQWYKRACHQLDSLGAVAREIAVVWSYCLLDSILVI